MALMLQTAVAEECPRIFELNKGMLINGNYYGKKDFTPFPFEQYFQRGYSYYLALNKTALNSNYAFYTTKFTQKVVDSENANIVYTFSQKDSNQIIISKILEDDTGITVLRTNSVTHAGLAGSSGGYEKVLEVVKQEPNYIWMLIGGMNCSLGLCKFNKTTLVMDYVSGNFLTTYYIKHKILKVTDTSLYMACTYSANMYIYKFNFISQVWTQLKYWPIGSTYSSYYYGILPFSLIEMVTPTGVAASDPSYYEEYHFAIRGIQKCTSNGLYYFLPMESTFRINYNTDTITNYSYRCMMDTSTQILSDSETIKYGVQYLSASWTDYMGMHVMTAADGTKTLFMIPLWCDTTRCPTNLRGIFRYFMTKKADGFWYFTDTMQLGDTGITLMNVLFTNDNKTMYVGKYQQPLEVWQWNEAEYTYKKTRSLCSNVSSYGLDDYETLWIVDENGLHWFSVKDVPVDIVMNSANLSYTYDNADINTYIQVGTKDLNANYISIKVRLTINGDAYFTDNNSKVIDVTTSNTGLTNVLVTLTGDGKVSVTPTFFVS